MRFLLCFILVSTPLTAQSPAWASADQAHRISLLATVIPVGAGAGILVAQGGGTHDRTAPVLLIMGGLLFGPGMGYNAAGMSGRGFRGVGVRAGLSLATIMASIAICGMDCNNRQTKYDTAGLVSLGGLGLITAAAAYDISRVRRNVHGHEARARAGMSIGPTYVPQTQRLGLGVSLSF